ncbi:MAG: GAF domain-containing protein [Acidimicrobiales bacterium]
MSEGSLSEGSLNEGPLNEGSLNEGSLNEGPLSEGLDDAGRARALQRVAEAMAADLDLRGVVQRVAKVVTEVSGADVCFVHLVDEEHKRIVLTGGTPPFDELAGTIELSVGDGVSGWVARHGTPAVVPDKWADARYRYIPALKGEDFASLVSLPMIRGGGRVVGVLNVHSRTHRDWSGVDVALLTDVARLLAGTVENALLHRRLAEREEALEGFAARTVEAQEAERHRLAGAIHDGISQRLVSLSYHLDAAASANPDEPDMVGSELRTARELVDSALQEAREAIAGLRPSLLDDLGLGASLESLVRTLAVADADVSLPTSVDLAPHVATTLYRIAQEALQNVSKHAGASRVRVDLYQRGPEAVLEVSDDGIGFEPKLTPATLASPATTYGLAGMRERAELIGGRLEVFSRPGGEGTRVKVVVPALADPALAEPALADPALADPALADPALADPALADPALADPARREPELPKTGTAP